MAINASVLASSYRVALQIRITGIGSIGARLNSVIDWLLNIVVVGSATKLVIRSLFTSAPSVASTQMVKDGRMPSNSQSIPKECKRR